MTRKPGTIRATLTIIGEAYREIPRTMAILTAWLLFFVGMLIWITVRDGIWWALFTAALAVAIGGGLSWLNQWAAKGDGLDEK